MSSIFRTIAAVTQTVEQAMSLAGIMTLILIVYTGFTLPVPYMHPWFAWLHYISMYLFSLTIHSARLTNLLSDPIYYAFEILMANEFHGREFTCSAIVPAYTPLQGDSWICSVAGAVAGRRTVSGDAFIAANYEYYYSHVWRNFGILIGFLIGFMAIYFLATELNSSTTSTAEVLVFRRGHAPKNMQGNPDDGTEDEEKGSGSSTKEGAESDSKENIIPPQTDLFTWRDLVYDIPLKGETRRLLDHVSGWVKPGTLTALSKFSSLGRLFSMLTESIVGVSGAGKTTLLDVLAERTTMGVITGDMFVNGKPLDASFQRKTGYVQQQGRSSQIITLLFCSVDNLLIFP